MDRKGDGRGQRSNGNCDNGSAAAMHGDLLESGEWITTVAVRPMARVRRQAVVRLRNAAYSDRTGRAGRTSLADVTRSPEGFSVPDDPADRPWKRRRAARVIIVDRQSRMLLFCDTDPGCPGQRWWVTPGGGLDPGETEAQAAVREVAEETGLRVGVDDLIGPVAHRQARHGYSDQVLDQYEPFYVIRVPAAFEPDTSAFTEEEKITLVEHRWWTRAELAATAEWIWPKELLKLLELADHPDEWPLDLGLVTDESTRPV
jgi:8-oxo-dGTP pyrophosphatase MutT (NUDIX family)